MRRKLDSGKSTSSVTDEAATPNSAQPTSDVVDRATTSKGSETKDSCPMGHIPLLTKISGPEEELGSSSTHTAVPFGEIFTDASLRLQDHTTSADGIDYDSGAPAGPRGAGG